MHNLNNLIAAIFLFSTQATLANPENQAAPSSRPLSIDGIWGQPPPKRKKRPRSNAQIIKQARKKNMRKNIKLIAKQIEVMELSADQFESILEKEDQNLASEIDSAFTN